MLSACFVGHNIHPRARGRDLNLRRSRWEESGREKMPLGLVCPSTLFCHGRSKAENGGAKFIVLGKIVQALHSLTSSLPNSVYVHVRPIPVHVRPNSSMVGLFVRIFPPYRVHWYSVNRSMLHRVGFHIFGTEHTLQQLYYGNRTNFTAGVPTCIPFLKVTGYHSQYCMQLQLECNTAGTACILKLQYPSIKSLHSTIVERSFYGASIFAERRSRTVSVPFRFSSIPFLFRYHSVLLVPARPV